MSDVDSTTPPPRRPKGKSHPHGRLLAGDLRHEPRVRKLINKKLGTGIIDGNRVRVLNDGPEIFPAMLEAIARARHRILLETYIFRDDSTGRSFRDALARKIAEGVEVYVLVDSVGAMDSGPIEADIREIGGYWAEVNPVRWLSQTFEVMNKRDHRKLLMVDGHIGFIGSVNIGDEYALQGEHTPYRDTHLEIRGPAVREMERAFCNVWEEQTQTRLSPVKSAARHAGDSEVLLIWESYRRQTKALEHLHRLVFGRARERIWIENSYFLPVRKLRRGLEAAAKRGLDVRIIVPGPTDAPIVREASRTLYPRLLRSGVRLFEYQPRVLHAKSMVVDQTWSMVGSTNLDHRSFIYNLEAQAVIYDEHLNAELAERFEKDLNECEEITMDEVKAWGLIEKLAHEISYRFRDWL